MSIMRDEIDSGPELRACYEALVADMGRVVARDRWGRAILILGWLHLLFFGACHLIYDVDVHGDPRHVALWVAEVAATVGLLRLCLGSGWYRATPLAGITVRVWLTFLILAFNVATMNSLTGWSMNWFKLTWPTLSTFGFATMAWMFSPWFLVPAVQMYLTGLVMVRNPEWVYLIYGLSWWAALQAIGGILEYRRVRASIPDAERLERRVEVARAN